jgi:hypothetical protein
MVITVDLVGTCAAAPEALSARTLNRLRCPDLPLIAQSEFVIARNGRMVASPCYLVGAATRAGLEVRELVRVDSAPVMGLGYVSGEPESSGSVDGSGVATYIVVLQHRRA